MVEVYEGNIAIREAVRLGIPVCGIVDTNSDPSNVDYVIPANDDAAASIEVILDACCAAINEGLEERKVEKADSDAAAAQQEAEAEAAEAPKMRHRTRKARVEAPAAAETEAKAGETPAEETK